MIENQYEYVEELLEQAHKIYHNIEEKYDTMSVEDIDHACYQIKSLLEDAEDIGREEDMDAPTRHLLYSLKGLWEEAEALLLEKEANL